MKRTSGSLRGALLVRVSLFGGALGALTVGARAAQAEPAKVAVFVEGQGSAGARAKLVAAVPSSVTVVDEAEFRAALRKAGQMAPLSGVLPRKAARGKAIENIREATRAVGARAAIVGVIRVSGRGAETYVVLVDAESGDVTMDEPILVRAEEAEYAATVGGALQPYASVDTGPTTTPTDEPKDEPEKKEDEPKEKDDLGGDFERKPFTPGEEIFSIAASLDLGARWFSYSDLLTGNLRDHSIFSPGFAFGLEVYPLATTGIPVVRGLGVTGTFGMQPAVDSTTNDGRVVSSTWLRGGGGLRMQIPVGRDLPIFGVSGGFVHAQFSFEADDATLVESAPAVAYDHLYAGLDLRIPAGPIGLLFFGKYLGAVSAGEVMKNFEEGPNGERDASIGGASMGGGLAVPIAYGFEPRVTVEYTRWFYSFTPLPGDGYVAGGALDQYLHVNIGAAFLY